MARPRTQPPVNLEGPGALDARTLSANTVTLREASKLSQEALAIRANISLRTLQRVERAESISDLDTVAAIAKALRMTTAQLLTR